VVAGFVFLGGNIPRFGGRYEGPISLNGGHMVAKSSFAAHVAATPAQRRIVELERKLELIGAALARRPMNVKAAERRLSRALEAHLEMFRRISGGEEVDPAEVDAVRDELTAAEAAMKVAADKRAIARFDAAPQFAGIKGRDLRLAERTAASQLAAVLASVEAEASRKAAAAERAVRDRPVAIRREIAVLRDRLSQPGVKRLPIGRQIAALEAELNKLTAK
jgi:hypothetical protein